MPSRRAVALILAFWVAVTGYVAYRDVWPVLFASGPPAVAIDLADEAAHRVPARWGVLWNGEKVGRMTTQMKYVEDDDTFRFTTEYTLRVKVPGGTVVVPEFTTVVRVTRAGDLREQSAAGRFEVHTGDLKVADATVKLTGAVADRQLAAVFEGSFGLVGATPRAVSKTLDPVPVPRGQPLNPMQPVNRIGGVRPGRPRWHVHESDPLGGAIRSLVRQLGANVPDERTGPLIGEVRPDRVELPWQKQAVECWVIEYRRDGQVEVRTWVRVADGKVLRQEASRKGETLAVERED